MGLHLAHCHSHGKSMVLGCISKHSKMPYDLLGNQRGYPCIAYVRKHSQWSMHAAAQKKPCPRSDTQPDEGHHSTVTHRGNLVCPNVVIEPTLQPLTGESFPLRSPNAEEGARLDIRVQNLWDNSKRSAYFIYRVFYSHPPSSTNGCYRRYEREKKIV